MIEEEESDDIGTESEKELRIKAFKSNDINKK